MMGAYRFSVLRRLGPGLLMVGEQVWHASKARKRHNCALTGKPIRPGDKAYRPVGNAQNRMHRILASVIDERLP